MFLDKDKWSLDPFDTFLMFLRRRYGHRRPVRIALDIIAVIAFVVGAAVLITMHYG